MSLGFTKARSLAKEMENLAREERELRESLPDVKKIMEESLANDLHSKRQAGSDFPSTSNNEVLYAHYTV